MRFAILALFCILGAKGQQAGDLTPEEHLPLPIQTCDSSGCQTENTAVVIDADTRYLYSVADSSRNCQLDSGGYDSELCPDGYTCASNCALNGYTAQEYQDKFGLTTSGSTVRLNYLTENAYGTQIGSRSYLSAEDGNYRMFHLKNRELSVEIDSSNLECGMNGGLYFSEMEQDGGTSSYPTNAAGAKYGSGYCDGQCFNWIKYSGGQVNVNGYSDYGVCCIEMDIWESNKLVKIM